MSSFLIIMIMDITNLFKIDHVAVRTRTWLWVCAYAHPRDRRFTHTHLQAGCVNMPLLPVHERVHTHTPHTHNFPQALTYGRTNAHTKTRT
jgi:hypothetical protein